MRTAAKANGPTFQRAANSRGRRGAGSATVEFVALIPLVLVVVGLVWDLREYVSHRTVLARQMFVAAEVIANQDCTPANCPGDAVIASVVERAVEQLEDRGAGTITVAVVARGDTQDPSDPTSDCLDAGGDPEWCLPRVVSRWPPVPAAPLTGEWWWEGENRCLNRPADLPIEGDHFDPTQPALPNENTGNCGTPACSDWPSRNLGDLDWWVLIDTCLHARPGLFFGRFGGSIGVFGGRDQTFFDVSQPAFMFQRRSAWGSPNDYRGP